MTNSLFRTRVAVLWLAVAIALASSMLLYLLVPGALEEMLAGEIEGETLDDALGFEMAMLMAIPVAMAVVTLLVGDRANRYLNLIAGLASGLFGAYAAAGEVAGGDFDAHVFMAAVAVVLAFVIAGLGWVELRQPAAPEAARESEQSRPREEVGV